MKNKKGLSAIVITLITIVLALVGIGAVWMVVNPIIKGGGQSTDLAAKCLNVQFDIVKLTCPTSTTATTTCDVVVKRTGSGVIDTLGGVKVVLKTVGGAQSSLLYTSPSTSATTLNTLLTTTTLAVPWGGIGSGITAVTLVKQVEVVPFFEDGSGNDLLCSQVVTYTSP